MIRLIQQSQDKEVYSHMFIVDLEEKKKKKKKKKNIKKIKG